MTELNKKQNKKKSFWNVQKKREGKKRRKEEKGRKRALGIFLINYKALSLFSN